MNQNITKKELSSLLKEYESIEDNLEIHTYISNKISELSAINNKNSQLYSKIENKYKNRIYIEEINNLVKNIKKYEVSNALDLENSIVLKNNIQELYRLVIQELEVYEDLENIENDLAECSSKLEVLDKYIKVVEKEQKKELKDLENFDKEDVKEEIDNFSNTLKKSKEVLSETEKVVNKFSKFKQVEEFQENKGEIAEINSLLSNQYLELEKSFLNLKDEDVKLKELAKAGILQASNLVKKLENNKRDFKRFFEREYNDIFDFVEECFKGFKESVLIEGNYKILQQQESEIENLIKKIKQKKHEIEAERAYENASTKSDYKDIIALYAGTRWASKAQNKVDSYNRRSSYSSSSYSSSSSWSSSSGSSSSFGGFGGGSFGGGASGSW